MRELLFERHFIKKYACYHCKRFEKVCLCQFRNSQCNLRFAFTRAYSDIVAQQLLSHCNHAIPSYLFYIYFYRRTLALILHPTLLYLLIIVTTEKHPFRPTFYSHGNIGKLKSGILNRFCYGAYKFHETKSHRCLGLVRTFFFPPKLLMTNSTIKTSHIAQTLETNVRTFSARFVIRKQLSSVSARFNAINETG